MFQGFRKKRKFPVIKKEDLIAPSVGQTTIGPISHFRINRIPDIYPIPDMDDKRQLDVKYPLIAPYSLVHIHWDIRRHELIYELYEPPLNDDEKKVLDILEKGIEELINISFIAIKSSEVVIEYLEKNMRILLREFGIKITEKSFLKLMYYVYRDFVGLNEIEPLMRDYYLEDIECNGINTPIYIVHRKYGNLRTNLMFTDIKSLSGFVEKLAQKCGKYVSYATPLLNGTLPDGSVDYNERFIYKEDGRVKVSSIGKFVDCYYKNKESNAPRNVKNIEVPAFDNDLKIKWKKLNYVYRHKFNEKLYELRLEAGRKVKLTGAHSVFVLRKDGVKPEKVSNLKENDYVVVPKILPENDVVRRINLAEELSKSKYYKKFLIEGVPIVLFKQKENEIRQYYRKNYKRQHQAYYEHKKKRILPIALYYMIPPNVLKECKLITISPVKVPVFLDVNKELMKLLGYYIAEGWLSEVGNHHKISFCLHKDETTHVNEINDCLKRCFSKELYLEPEKNNARKLHINSILIYAVFEEVLKVTKGAKKKEIPEIVFNVSKELQLEFITAWHNGDFGSTVSMNLASDIAYLSLFNENIVPFYDRQRTSLIEDREVKSHEFYSNFYSRKISDFHTMIPVELFNPLNKTHMRLGNKRIRRNRLHRILDDIRFKRFEDLKIKPTKKFLMEWSKRGFMTFFDNEPLLTKKGQELVYELNFVRKLINSDLAFLRINKISMVSSDSEYVYDVSVPNGENFIAGFGGICCHNSRANATYTQDITSRGPSFSIRKFTKEPWTPVKLMQFRTVSPEMLAYLWLLIEYEANILIIGPTGCGKTTFLNSIAFFIPPEARIVSIEDTREISLLHDNWLPSVAREGVGVSNLAGEKYGEVSLFDLLKESFRQRPDYVIVGEIRGKEAFVLFQAMSSGHPSISTMHAEDVETMIRRLETPPISLSPSLVESLDVICLMIQTKAKGKSARRIRDLVEVLKVQERIGRANTNNPFTWDPRYDKFYYKSDSKIFDKLVTRYGVRREELDLEFKRRTQLLMKMLNMDMTGFKQVQDVINAYYKTPELVLKKFGIS